MAAKKKAAAVSVPPADAIPSAHGMAPVAHVTAADRKAAKEAKRAEKKEAKAEKSAAASSAWSVHSLGDMEDPTVYRHLTGIIELDIQLAGGWPCGGVSVVSGTDNVGKSWLLYMTLAYLQRLYGPRASALLICSESTTPYNQMLKCGCRIAQPQNTIEMYNVARMQQGRPAYTPEQIQFLRTSVGTIDIGTAPDGETLFQGLLAAIHSQKYQLVLVDSIDSVAPADTMEKELEEEDKQAASARLVTRFLQRLAPVYAMSTGKNRTCVLATQQMRANRNKGKNPYAPDLVVTGAQKLKHDALNRLIVRDGELKKKQIRGVTSVVGKTLHWSFDKGKAGSRDNQYGEVDFDYTYEPGFCDVPSMLVDAAASRNLIQQDGNGNMHLMQAAALERGEPVSLANAPDINAMKQWIASDIRNELTFRNEILSAAGIVWTYNLQY